MIEPVITADTHLTKRAQEFEKALQDIVDLIPTRHAYDRCTPLEKRLFMLAEDALNRKQPSGIINPEGLL